MTNTLELLKDNTEEHAPINPIVTYEIIVDMGENGTKTVFSSDSFAECAYEELSNLRKGKLSNLDITEEELQEVEKIGVSIVLTATKLEIIQYDGETSATAELLTYKVIKE